MRALKLFVARSVAACYSWRVKKWGPYYFETDPVKCRIILSATQYLLENSRRYWKVCEEGTGGISEFRGTQKEVLTHVSKIGGIIFVDTINAVAVYTRRRNENV